MRGIGLNWGVVGVFCFLPAIVSISEPLTIFFLCLFYNCYIISVLTILNLWYNIYYVKYKGRFNLISSKPMAATSGGGSSRVIRFFYLRGGRLFFFFYQIFFTIIFKFNEGKQQYFFYLWPL